MYALNAATSSSFASSPMCPQRPKRSLHAAQSARDCHRIVAFAVVVVVVPVVVLVLVAVAAAAGVVVDVAVVAAAAAAAVVVVVVVVFLVLVLVPLFRSFLNLFMLLFGRMLGGSH